LENKVFDIPDARCNQEANTNWILKFLQEYFISRSTEMRDTFTPGGSSVQRSGLRL